MAKYISVDKTLHVIRNKMKNRVLTGETMIPLQEVLTTINTEPTYDTNKVITEVTKLLVTEDKRKNCLSGSGTELVIVTTEILDEIINLIESGGTRHDGINQ